MKLYSNNLIVRYLILAVFFMVSPLPAYSQSSTTSDSMVKCQQSTTTGLHVDDVVNSEEHCYQGAFGTHSGIGHTAKIFPGTNGTVECRDNSMNYCDGCCGPSHTICVSEMKPGEVVCCGFQEDMVIRISPNQSDAHVEVFENSATKIYGASIFDW